MLRCWLESASWKLAPPMTVDRVGETGSSVLGTRESSYLVFAETRVNGTKAPRANRLSVTAPQVAGHLLDDSVVDEEMAAG
jgi:hypothetical protein